MTIDQVHHDMSALHTLCNNLGSIVSD